MNWLPVMTNPRSEHLAIDQAQKAGWTVFMPRVRVKIARRGLKTWVARPYLPGYIFCAYAPDLSLWALSKLPGVSTVVRMGDMPVIIPEKDPDMTRLLDMTDEHGFIKKPDVEPISRLEIGDLITIPENTAFGAGHRATILGIDNAKFITVELTIFGAKRPVQVRRADVDLTSVERRRIPQTQLSASFT